MSLGKLCPAGPITFGGTGAEACLPSCEKEEWKDRAGAGLEGFVEWVDSIASDQVEEMEDDMSSLAVGFSRGVSAQGEITLGSKVYGGKSFRRSGLDGKAQKSPAVITVDSSE